MSWPRRRAVDRHDPVARLQACGGRRRAAQIGLDGRGRLSGRGHEETREEHEREDDVRRRPGADRRDALPRGRSPVGGRAECVRRGRRAPSRARQPCSRSELLLGGELAQHAQRVARGVVVVGRQRTAQARCGALERRRLRSARPRPMSTSRGPGRCMPGIFTKPPSGIAPKPYSIPFRVRLRRSRAESDVEAAAGAFRARARRRMAQLVDEISSPRPTIAMRWSCRPSSPRAASRARLVVGRDEVVEVARGRAVDPRECLVDHVGDLGERRAGPPGTRRPRPRSRR